MQLRTLPSWQFMLLMCLLALLLRGLPYVWLKKYSSIFLIIVLGCSWHVLRANELLAWQLPWSSQKKTIVIEGTVSSIPQHKQRQQQFLFQAHNLLNSQKTIRLLLSWYAEAPTLRVGEKWRLSVRLKRPHSLANPGGFDYEQWLFSQGIRAVGYVVPRLQHQRLSGAGMRYPIHQLRQVIAKKIQHALGSKTGTGVIKALTIGVRDSVTAKQWQIFRATGTTHLLAISGLHVGLIAAWGYGFTRFIWWCLPRLGLYMAALRVAPFGGLFVAFFYACLAGWAVSTQRAFIMLSCCMLANFLYKNMTTWHVLSVALLLVLLLDPLSSLTVGFYLSFAAVAVIYYGNVGRVTKGFYKILRIQWVVSIGLLPLSLLFFQQTSWIAWPANMIAIPWLGFVIVPLSLLGSALLFVKPVMATMMLQWAIHALQLLWAYLAWLAHWPHVQWQHAIDNQWQFIAIAIGVLLLTATRKWPARLLSGIYLLPLFVSRASPIAIGDAQLTLLDVGQGLAAIIRTSQHVLLFDTGPKYADHFDAAESVILPYLRQKHIKRIDRLVVSHADMDHRGGADTLLRKVIVGDVYTGASGYFSKGYACVAGQQWEWDGVLFQFLHPSWITPYGRNNESCVLRIVVGNKRILLSGDIEYLAEQELVKKYPSYLAADILIAPHHGSKSSSSVRFITAVSPQYVLFPTGYLNRYHFPHTMVSNRYRHLGSKKYNTAYSGAIIFEIQAGKPLLTPREYRKFNAHYWSNIEITSNI